MEFNERTQAITTTTALLNASDERPVDMDVVLPDYCPDVAAILCCELIPSISASGFNGDKLTADGVALLRVLYLDEERKTVRSYEMSQAFSASFLTDGPTGNTATDITATADYVHCRAVSPRRLDIHGAVRVKASVAAAAAQTVLAKVEDENVFVKTETVTTSVPSGFAQKPFSINETLSSAEGIARVLRSHAVPTVSETKVLAGRIIVKGDLHITALLLCDEESGRTEEKHFTLPFSQMLDFAGVDENAIVDAAVKPIAHSVRIEEDGEQKSLFSSTKLLLCAQAWSEETAALVTDAYSTAMPVTLQTQSVESRRLRSVSGETVTVNETVSLPEGAASLLSVWGEAVPLSSETADGMRAVNGRLSVHLLFVDHNGQVQYGECETDFFERFSAVGEGEETAFSVVSCEAFSENEGQMTVKATLHAVRRQFDADSHTAVTAVTGDETAAYPAQEAAVKIVYADAGESLWEVAKAGHTSVSALKAENELEGEVLTARTMMLIPLI